MNIKRPWLYENDSEFEKVRDKILRCGDCGRFIMDLSIDKNFNKIVNEWFLTCRKCGAKLTVLYSDDGDNFFMSYRGRRKRKIKKEQKQSLKDNNVDLRNSL